jgi:hypothetical protein
MSPGSTSAPTPNELGDPVRIRECANDLRLGLGLPVVLAERRAAEFEHALDEIVELEERVARVLSEAILEVARLVLPFASVEAGLLRLGSVPRARGRQTPQ